MKQQDYQQLPLSFTPRERFVFDTFIPGPNQLAINLIIEQANASGEQQIFLSAAKGGGKSHLLQAACNQASLGQQSVCYLPAAEIITASGQVFDGLEQLDLVCLDDIHLFMQQGAWEESLFDLINRMRESGKSLLFASAQPLEALAINLPDLRSRLAWGPVFQLLELDDEDKITALRVRAEQYGLELAENVGRYLLSHYPRNLFELFERLDRLDRASMAMQRRLTIPFIKGVLQQSGSV